jgi:hypothetical protein
MPDGKRKRRFSLVWSKREYYSVWRSFRFNRRFGLGEPFNFLAVLTVALMMKGQVCE